MMARSRRILFVALLVLAVVLVIFLCALWMAYATRRQAEGLLAAVQQVRVGVADYKAVSQITAPYRAYSTESSDRDVHQIQFSFDNSWLFRLHLAPYTDFRVRIVLKDNVVIEKFGREFVANCDCVASVMEVKRGLPFPERSIRNQDSNHAVFGGVQDLSIPIRHIAVYDDNTYGETGLHKDWDFDLSCLTRLGGCRDAREMLPGATPTQG